MKSKPSTRSNGTKYPKRGSNVDLLPNPLQMVDLPGKDYKTLPSWINWLLLRGSVPDRDRPSEFIPGRSHKTRTNMVVAVPVQTLGRLEELSHELSNSVGLISGWVQMSCKKPNKELRQRLQVILCLSMRATVTLEELMRDLGELHRDAFRWHWWRYLAR